MTHLVDIAKNKHGKAYSLESFSARLKVIKKIKNKRSKNLWHFFITIETDLTTKLT